MSGYTAMAIAIGGMAMSAVGAKQQQDVANRNIAAANNAARANAIAAQQQAHFLAQQERNNAAIVGQNVVYIKQAAKVASQRHGERIRKTVAAVNVRTAAMGFLVDPKETTEDVYSTVTLLRADVEWGGARDIRDIYHNAALEERRALIQRENFVAQAGLFEWKAAQGDTGVGYGTGASSAYAATAAFMSGAGNAYSLRPA